jgi:predicted TIM-barrel fold metal-dependent hydrolase
VGIRLNLIGTKLPDLAAAPWPALIEKLRKLNWLVEIQREARDLPLVVRPLVAAGLNVVVDHFGRPDPGQGIDDPGFRYLLETAASRRLWLKLSGAYRNGPNGRGDALANAAIPLVREAFGVDRLLWGSDWPHTQFERVASYGAVRAQFDTWITDPAERAAILGATPLKLFRFPTAATQSLHQGSISAGAALHA